MKVFLGGTCNGSSWRDELIERLEIDYFNPVVPDWTPECMEEELRQREHCDFVLYVITPKMTGVYSIAEVIDDSNKRPEKTLFCVLDTDMNRTMRINMKVLEKVEFEEHQLKSLYAVSQMVERNGGKSFDGLKAVADFLNQYQEKI